MPFTTILIILIALIIIGAVTLVVVGMRDASGEDPLQERLAEFAARGETVNLEQIELSQPFSDRVIVPLARKFGDFATRFTPQNAIQSAAHKIELAGNPRMLDPATFWASRFFVAIFLGSFLIFIFSISKMSIGLLQRLLVVGLFMLLGFYIPEMLLSSRIGFTRNGIMSFPLRLDVSSEKFNWVSCAVMHCATWPIDWASPK
jgi:tight adherence protein C